MLVPFTWSVPCFFREDFCERGWRREAGKGSYLRYFQFGTLAHEALGFLNAETVGELIERTAIGIVNELTKIRSVHR